MHCVPKQVRFRNWLAALVAVPLVLGCGGDEEESSSSRPKRTPSSRAQAAAPVAGQPGAAAAPTSYPKVEEALRHTFVDSDFISDPTGESNRDPFRSWLHTQRLDPVQEEQPQTVDVCTKENVRWGAENYSVRDLDLIGLVKRGRSYAQFTDKSDTDSWIVRKGDCLGQEKAIIEEIGLGYVRLSITPEVPPNAPAPKAQKQDIPLHADELELSETIKSKFDE